ncbi:MAG TPA: hypothetical protein VJ987_09460 [Anaerolineales bacterium]|nr:hypothetical protein [Anaerolineales bacterium]
MKYNKRNLSTIFLILGIISLAIGWSIDNTIFSWAAIAFIIISLILGGRWMRHRKR